MDEPKPKREMYFKIRGKSFIIRCRGRTYSTSVGHVQKLLQKRIRFLYIDIRKKGEGSEVYKTYKPHKREILGYNQKGGL